MRKVISIILIVTFICTSFCGCANNQTITSLEKFSDVIFDAFDTVITITAYCKDESEFAELFDYAAGEFVRYHRLYDIYNSYPGITNVKDVNDQAANAPVSVNREIIDLISFGKTMYSETDGKVNIAMGSVLKLWHDAREKAINDKIGLIPEQEVLKAAAAHCDFEDVIIDAQKNTVYFNDSELKLDVGAIAKGYATEKVMDGLVDLGFDHVLINAGGNVKTHGFKPDNAKWTIGIQDPDVKSGETYVKTVKVESNSVVTSGVYERNFVANGKTYHHIIDPDTLMPEDRFLSVSIITENSATADALSTAVFNMDLTTGKIFIESLPGVEAMWILNDKSQECTSGFEAYLK